MLLILSSKLKTLSLLTWLLSQLLPASMMCLVREAIKGVCATEQEPACTCTGVLSQCSPLSMLPTSLLCRSCSSLDLVGTYWRFRLLFKMHPTPEPYSLSLPQNTVFLFTVSCNLHYLCLFIVLQTVILTSTHIQIPLQLFM